MDHISIEKIITYPVKGLAGIQSDSVLLKTSGLSGDRRWAVSCGALSVAENGIWTPCQAFERLTISPQLTKVELLAENGWVKIKQATNSVEFNPSANIDDITPLQQAQIRAIFDEKSELVRSQDKTGYWDHEDAKVSIINVDTVAEISRLTGRKIDPMRFRGNILVRAEPWSEFNWLGKQLSVNGVVLNVIRPIDRCSATSVNPIEGVADMNMPVELEKHFGHMFCGVYADIEVAGTIAVNDKMILSHTVDIDSLNGAIAQKTAPKLPAWPRSTCVTDIITEAEGIRSIVFSDPLVQKNVMADFLPGQYFRFHALKSSSSQSTVWRSYSVSGFDKSNTRITVKRESGDGSNSMHALNVGDQLLVTGPFGEAVLKSTKAPLVLLSAGIGITPHAQIVQRLASLHDKRRVVVFHVARKSQQVALWDEILNCSTQLQNIETHLYLTQEKSNKANYGRPDLNKITQLAADIDADIYCCGPGAFMEGFNQACETADLPSSRIITEVFLTPSINVEFMEPLEKGPFNIEFRGSAVQGQWHKSDGTLLEFAESLGLILPSHCRAGVCGSCKQTLLKGQTISLLSGEKNSNNTVLLCCSSPTEDIVIDV
jgi:ferredoxin-NADP reductase/uncharacterized protein YcbX